MPISPDTLAAASRIVLSTGDVPDMYPVDIVFTSTIVGKLESDSLQDAFSRARQELRIAALAAGGHGVANCRFEHTIHAQSSSQSTQSSVFTVVGYGTLVKKREAHGDRF